jgi:hypothetical protein
MPSANSGTPFGGPLNRDGLAGDWQYWSGMRRWIRSNTA